MLHRLMPGRTKVAGATDFCIDLDAFTNEPTPFRWNGKIHYIKEMTVEHYIPMAAELLKVKTLYDKKEITEAELYQVYGDLICASCSTISAEDVKRMSPVQIIRLYQLILNCLNGKPAEDAGSEDEKKKRLSRPV